jgi:hypothetical protein
VAVQGVVDTKHKRNKDSCRQSQGG